MSPTPTALRRVESVQKTGIDTWDVLLVCGHTEQVTSYEEPVLWMLNCHTCQTVIITSGELFDA